MQDACKLHTSCMHHVGSDVCNSNSALPAPLPLRCQCVAIIYHFVMTFPKLYTYGNALAMSWQRVGNVMATRWQRYDNVLATPWQYETNFRKLPHKLQTRESVTYCGRVAMALPKLTILPTRCQIWQRHCNTVALP